MAGDLKDCIDDIKDVYDILSTVVFFYHKESKKDSFEVNIKSKKYTLKIIKNDNVVEMGIEGDDLPKSKIEKYKFFNVILNKVSKRYLKRLRKKNEKNMALSVRYKEETYDVWLDSDEIVRISKNQ